MSDPPSPEFGQHHQSEAAAFEQVDWDRLSTSRGWVSAERVTLVVGLVILGALFLNHRQDGGLYLVYRWRASWENWLVMLGLVVMVAYYLVPALRTNRIGDMLDTLRGRWGTILSLGAFTLIVIVGGAALFTGYRALIPWETGIHQLQPPAWSSVTVQRAQDCLGSVIGEPPYPTCHGTWEYPLGTDRSGYKLTELLVMGTRPVFYATVVTLGIIVPLAAVVGVVAGYYGGVIDDLLMAYVDIQLSFPAILVYLIAYMFILNSLFVFLVAFGLLSWGGIARIVRSETLQRREEGYVMTARAIGASDREIIRRHLLPNVSNSVIPAAFHLIAIIVLTEAALSFFGFNAIDQSWGHTITRGLTDVSPIGHWWVATFPALALAATVLACKVLGDGLRDIADPRGNR